MIFFFNFIFVSPSSCAVSEQLEWPDCKLHGDWTQVPRTGGACLSPSWEGDAAEIHDPHEAPPRGCSGTQKSTFVSLKEGRERLATHETVSRVASMRSRKAGLVLMPGPAPGWNAHRTWCRWMQSFLFGKLWCTKCSSTATHPGLSQCHPLLALHVLSVFW